MFYYKTLYSQIWVFILSGWMAIIYQPLYYIVKKVQIIHLNMREPQLHWERHKNLTETIKK